MKSLTSLLLALPLMAAAPPLPTAPASPQAKSPAEIVAEAPAEDWVDILPSDLLVMDLAADGQGRARRVVIQLAPAPFATGWVSNVRKLAQVRWWDGLAIVRVQDNYVVQWGDPEAETPARARPLPEDLARMAERDYVARGRLSLATGMNAVFVPRNTQQQWSGFYRGWPVAGELGADGTANWLVHCYGMIGAGRNLSPDTGSGAELYAVIGHAPRHLDRNIALVGRVVQGIEHLSSLPRGTGSLGFYQTVGERTQIEAVRLATDMVARERPHFAYLSTDSASFRAYAAARANRRDAFFNRPSGGTDLCNIPVPVRAVDGVK